MESQVGHDTDASDEYGESVLVVADDSATRQSLASVLTSAEIEAFPTEAQDALAAQALYHPSVALVEHAPGLIDGLLVSARLKERDPDISVLLLTDPAFLASAQASELVDQYLVKPLATAAFIQTVRNALSRRGLMTAYQSLAARVGRGDPDTVVAVAPPDHWPAEEAAPVVPRRPAREEPAPATPVAVPTVEADADQSHHVEDVPLEPATVRLPAPEPVGLHDALREALTVTAPTSRTAAVLLVRFGLPERYGLTWPQHGAAILARVSELLSAPRRRGDRVVRVDAESFAVICLDVDSATTAEAIAKAVTRELSVPFTIDGIDVRLDVTIGVVLAESGEDASPARSPEALLEDAGLAARMAVEEGLSWKLFDDSIGEGVRLKQRLLRAMDNGELDLDFQKIVDLQTRKVVGAEAFLRWRRPGNETICAAEFLDKAYEAGMAAPLARWVFDRALSELASWRANDVLAEEFRLFVNVGAEDLAVPDFAGTVEKLLRDHGVAPTMLAIEMPETALGEAVEDANSLRALRSLGDLGVACVVDDFGTGRSNLDWLHELPITGLKINPELVSVLDHSEDRRGPALVRGVIALGHELQMTVVGEGVESVSQEVALRAMGCDLAQGHQLGRPERSAQLAAALA